MQDLCESLIGPLLDAVLVGLYLETRPAMAPADIVCSRDP